MEFVTFTQFAAAAQARGMVAVKYSGTGYYIKAKNGIRVEFQNTRGGVYGVGYTNNAKQVQAVYEALKAAPPKGLNLIAKLKGSFNYRATTLEDFFSLVETVGTVKLPFTGRGHTDAVVVETAKVEAPADTAKPALPAPAKPTVPAKVKAA